MIILLAAALVAFGVWFAHDGLSRPSTRDTRPPSRACCASRIGWCKLESRVSHYAWSRLCAPFSAACSRNWYSDRPSPTWWALCLVHLLIPLAARPQCRSQVARSTCASRSYRPASRRTCQWTHSRPGIRRACGRRTGSAPARCSANSMPSSGTSNLRQLCRICATAWRIPRSIWSRALCFSTAKSVASGFGARDRKRRILTELPQLVRLLPGAISAGLVPDAALARVARHSGGARYRVRRAQQDVAAGRQRLLPALVALAEREDVPEMGALIAQLPAADEQGLPLARTLEVMAICLVERQAVRLMEQARRAACAWCCLWASS
jgi:hypothetical protein